MKKLFLLLALALGVAFGGQAQVKVYDESLDAMQQIQEATELAQKSGRYVLCQVGGNWCPWCLKFANFITNDSTISQIINDNFVYIHVSYNPRKSQSEEKIAQGKALMKRLNNAGRFGYPVLVVINTEGAVIHLQDSGLLEEGEGYNQEKVLQFFKKWTPQAVKGE